MYGEAMHTTKRFASGVVHPDETFTMLIDGRQARVRVVDIQPVERGTVEAELEILDMA
jgi:hypothetical protein